MLTALVLIAGLAAEAPAPVITVAAIDRAVKKLDLRAETATFVATHPGPASSGQAPGYAAVVTVESQAFKLEPVIPGWKMLPHTGIGGLQGPSYDKHTGIPWWM